MNSLPNDTPVGGTPITSAIIAAVDNLKLAKYLNYERSIILVTDGEENGGGDYKIAVENAMSLNGIKCKIHIIGIALDIKAENKAKQLALSTQGTYVPVKAINYNSHEIKQALAPLKISVVQETLQNIKSQIVELSPGIDAKIETLNRKLENINKENDKNILEDQIIELKTHIDQIKFDNQKITSEFSVLLDNKQFPLLIKSSEGSILNSIDYSILNSNTNFENVTKELNLIKEIVVNKSEEINFCIQDIFKNQAAHNTSMSAHNNDFFILLNKINRNSKRQILLIYISWGLITLLTLFIFYVAFRNGYVRL